MPEATIFPATCLASPLANACKAQATKRLTSKRRMRSASRAAPLLASPPSSMSRTKASRIGPANASGAVLGEPFVALLFGHQRESLVRLRWFCMGFSLFRRLVSTLIYVRLIFGSV